MIIAAALTALAAVLVLGWLRLMGFWPYHQDALHAAPRHHGHADVWDDGEAIEDDQDGWPEKAMRFAARGARPGPPVLRITARPRLARFLIAAGAQPAEPERPEPPLPPLPAPVSQQDIDERDGYLERGLGLPDDDDEQWAPLLRRHLDAGGAPPVTEREYRALAARIRDAQSRPLAVLPATPVYRPPPVDRAPRVTAGRHAANRSAGQEGPRMMPLLTEDERRFPHLARTWRDETGQLAAYCEVGNG